MSVACNLAKVLMEEGDDVLLLAGARGFNDLPDEIEGVPCKLFPAVTVSRRLGFSGLMSPHMYLWMWKRLREFDLVHIHLAREPQTMLAAEIALASDVPLVIQTHGMVDTPARPLASLADLRLRGYLKRARMIFVLNAQERADVIDIARSNSISVRELPNGVPYVDDLIPWDDRDGIVFLARLASRKRPVEVVRAVVELNRRGFEVPKVLFAGPDEGELPALQEAIQSSPSALDIQYLGPIKHTEVLDLLRSAQVMVLPSVNEPFPMSVLEALSCGTPVVVEQSCGLADFVAKSGGGVVVSEELNSLVMGIHDVLMNAEPMGQAGYSAVRRVLNLSEVGKRLKRAYEDVLLSNMR